MSVRAVTFYKVVCDGAGCKFETIDVGGEYAAWADEDAAVTEWVDSDHQQTDDGKHYCDKHRVPVCCDCDSPKVVANYEPDGSGDWYCAQHAPQEKL